MRLPQGHMWVSTMPSLRHSPRVPEGAQAREGEEMECRQRVSGALLLPLSTGREGARDARGHGAARPSLCSQGATNSAERQDKFYLGQGNLDAELKEIGCSLDPPQHPSTPQPSHAHPRAPLSPFRPLSPRLFRLRSSFGRNGTVLVLGTQEGNLETPSTSLFPSFPFSPLLLSTTCCYLFLHVHEIPIALCAASFLARRHVPATQR